jgi:hypothetical protein
MMVTPAQCHAGRILAEIDRDELASKAGLSAEAVFAFETCDASLATSDVEKLQHALQAFRVRFIPEDADGGAGVRLKFDHEQTSQLSAWESEGGVAADNHVT